MKEVTLKIPDKKLNFFMELIKQLGIEVSEKEGLPEEHKKIVKERINTAKEDDFITWNEARKQLKLKP